MKGFVQLGHDVEAIIGNLASFVRAGHSMNLPPAAIPAVSGNF